MPSGPASCENGCQRRKRTAGRITLKTLVQLHTNVMATLNEHRRSQCRWEQLVEEGVHMERVIEAYNSEDRQIAGFKEYKHMTQSIIFAQWVWFTWIRPIFCKVLSLFSGVMSILVVLGEITLFIDYPVGALY